MTEHASSGVELVVFHVLESKQSLVGRSTFRQSAKSILKLWHFAFLTTWPTLLCRRPVDFAFTLNSPVKAAGKLCSKKEGAKKNPTRNHNSEGLWNS